MIYARQLKATGTLIVSMKEMLKNDVFNFFILLVLILAGWSYILTQLLRSYIFDYRNVGVTLITLLKSVLGGVEFVDSTGNIIQESISNVLLGLFSLVVLVLLINLLIAMMGNTYEQIQEEAINHWSFSKAQSLIYYEKSHWIPPFNIVGEAVMLVIWLSNTLTCGLVSKTTGVSDDFAMSKLTDNVLGKKKLLGETEQSVYRFSREAVRRIIYPEDVKLTRGTTIAEDDSSSYDHSSEEATSKSLLYE